MNDYTVSDVESLADRAGREWWHVRMTKPDGTGHVHAFPKETLEWRAAEYGLTDIGEILDIVLHEPYRIPETDPQRMHEDPALEAGIGVTAGRPIGRFKAGDRIPVTLYSAASTAVALAAHRLRIEHTKKNLTRVVSPKGTDPLDVIRAGHGVDPGRVRVKRELVDVHRWNRLYGGLPVPVTDNPEAPHA